MVLLLAGIPALADLTGRWSPGGTSVFVLRQHGHSLTGTIVGQSGEPAFKIVDGVMGTKSASLYCTRPRTTRK